MRIRIIFLSLALSALCVVQLSGHAAGASRGYSIPLIDLANESQRQVVVDREPGQYLGHPTTVLLEDGRTMLCVYPKGHGRGAIVLKRSTDGGFTWSERLPVPPSWETSKETPTIHRVTDAGGKRRLILWSGMYPARLAVSEDDGRTWTELKPAGDWGGIVVMGCLEPVEKPGRYLAMFHDDGRFFSATPSAAKPPVFTLYKTFSEDGGLTWSQPEPIFARSDVHLCEPGLVRSPDGKEIAVLLRENLRRRNSHIIFSRDEGRTWSEPKELPGALTGDRHTGKYAPDGRLFLSFRDTTLESPTKGDWVGWVGTYEDLRQGREGLYRVRLMKNHKAADCAYPGVEVLPDGTFVTTTYGHWTSNAQPYVVSVRFKLAELDERTTAAPGARAAGAGMQALISPETGQCEIREAGQLVLVYNHQTIQPGAVFDRVSEANRIYARARSDYIHPLLGLDGETLTADWPVDHPHHRGVYWAWPEVDFGKERGDLHALQKVFARPIGKPKLTSGSEYAQVEAGSHWLWEDREPIVREGVLIRAGKTLGNQRAIDLVFQFTALKEGVSLARRGTDKYGGLNIRMATPKDQKIVTMTDAPGSQPRRCWSDLSGLFAGAEGLSGLTVFQHPGNPDYPGDWVQFPELSWCQPTFPASGTRFALVPGRPLVLRFRLVVHRGGNPEPAEFSRNWEEMTKSEPGLPEPVPGF